MGTPDFAVATLQALVENGKNVVAVITVPDKPAGRGQKLQVSSVKQYAVAQGIPVMQPEKLRNTNFLAELQSYQADLQIVVAFRMLPEVVWSMPKKGTFNLHGSLLPQYRGAAPINWAVMNGETETGVTTFFIEKEIDTGNIIFSDKLEISVSDSAGTVHDRMMHIGAALVIKTVEAIETNTAPSSPQPEFETLKAAPKIFKETCEINWNKPAKQVYDFIRGLSPYPGAWCMWQEKVVKIFGTTIVHEAIEETETWYSDGKKKLYFKAQDAWLAVEELQMEGKKRLKTEDFLRGFKVS